MPDGRYVARIVDVLLPLSRTERVESYDFHGRGILSIPFTAFAWSDGTVARTAPWPPRA